MRKLIILVVATLIFRSVTAQVISPFTINIAGGSYNDPAAYNRYFDWSAGELSLVHTKASNDSAVVLYQGVLQPGTEKPGLSVFSADFTPEDVKLFPNPTVGRFEINFFLNERGILDLELTDATGRLIERRSRPYGGCCRIEQYDISRLPAGIYFIIATLRPDPAQIYNTRMEPRRSGLRVVKLNP